MKQFDCGSLVPGCTWQAQAGENAELIRRVVHHLKTSHDETTVRPNLIEEIKQRIKDVENA